MAEICGAWGGCPLPAGHNMGKPDIPENHAEPDSPTLAEYREAYEKWHAAGQEMHGVLLTLWRAVTPDSEYGVFQSPQEVEEAVLSALRASERLAYDSDTNAKVYWALSRSGLSDIEVTDAINEMQNAGILFRERVEDSADW